MEQDPPTVELLGMGKLRTTAWQLLCGWFYQCSIPELFFGLEGFIFGHHWYSEIPIPPHTSGFRLGLGCWDGSTVLLPVTLLIAQTVYSRKGSLEDI